MPWFKNYSPLRTPQEKLQRVRQVRFFGSIADVNPFPVYACRLELRSQFLGVNSVNLDVFVASPIEDRGEPDQLLGDPRDIT